MIPNLHYNFYNEQEEGRLTIVLQGIIRLYYCRIDQNGVIKVADFGLTEDMYGTNYYRRMKGKTGDDEKVPIRWMPPESIENDIYNEMTDVVMTFIPLVSTIHLIFHKNHNYCDEYCKQTPTNGTSMFHKIHCYCTACAITCSRLHA